MACPYQKLKRYTWRMDPTGVVEKVKNKETKESSWAEKVHRIKTLSLKEVGGGCFLFGSYILMVLAKKQE